MKLPNERTRLSKDEIDEIIHLYCYKGWKEAHIARKLLRNKATIRFQILTKHLVRFVPEVTARPQEILYTYDDDTADIFQEDIEIKTYEDYLEEDRKRKQQNCQHFHWVKKCSHCGKIIESDASKHAHERGVLTEAGYQPLNMA